MGSSTIARGNILSTKVFSTVLTPVSVAAATTAEQNFAINGIQPGDYINCQCIGAQTAGISVANVRIIAVNTVTIAFNNSTAGALTPAATTYGFVWGRPEQLPLDTNAL